MPDLIIKKEQQEEDCDNNSRIRLALIVSNETNTLSVLTRYLKAKSFQVYGFTNPLKAFEHFKKHPKGYCIVKTAPHTKHTKSAVILEMAYHYCRDFFHHHCGTLLSIPKNNSG